ncbi:MAG: hypothetical protein ACKPKO_35325, partial [Candidatus Fonsibacter sp.]
HPCVAPPCVPNSDFIPSGPKFFAVASLGDSPRHVNFNLPKGYKEKTTIGMNNPWRNQGRWKKGGPIELDDQYLFLSGLGYMSARQNAIELAKVVDRDCDSLGITRYPLGVGSYVKTAGRPVSEQSTQ